MILRRILRDRQQGQCGICGRDWTGRRMNVLHVIDMKDGGTNDPGNLIGACDDCADEKSRGTWGMVG